MTYPLLEMRDVSKSYDAGGKGRQTALKNASLSLSDGEALGLTGPSGSGKSTLARIALGLERPDAGRVSFLGNDMTRLSRRKQRTHFRSVQMVWQDPAVYLNPYQDAQTAIAEPMIAFGVLPGNQCRHRAAELMEMVGLPRSASRRRPAQLSGGQCQRVAIARALSVSPRLLICDEVLVSLDLPQQVAILQLLKRLRQELGLSILFISHDMGAVRALCLRTVALEADRYPKRERQDV
jgi:peptide/nickel transport system ATP-binding protein